MAGGGEATSVAFTKANGTTNVLEPIGFTYHRIATFQDFRANLPKGILPMRVANGRKVAGDRAGVLASRHKDAQTNILKEAIPQ